MFVFVFSFSIFPFCCVYTLVINIDPENHPFLVETHLLTPTTGRVYVNLLEGNPSTSVTSGRPARQKAVVLELESPKRVGVPRVPGDGAWKKGGGIPSGND